MAPCGEAATTAASNASRHAEALATHAAMSRLSCSQPLQDPKGSAAGSADVLAAEQFIVPSTELRCALTLSIAEHLGVCT